MTNKTGILLSNIQRILRKRTVEMLCIKNKQTFLFLLILLFGTVTAKTQNDTNKHTYLPLEEEGKIWTVLYERNDGFPNYCIDFTIINNTIYRIQQHLQYEGSIILHNDYLYIYEDATTFPSVFSYTMYDFSKRNIGDIVYVGGSAIKLQLDSISKIVLNDDISRRIYWWTYVDWPSYKETWIEGIGSSCGLHHAGNALPLLYKNTLICVSQNGKVIYQNPDFEPCGIVNISNLNSKQSNINIFPNPTQDIFYIENNDNLDINCISLLNIMGQTVSQYKPDIKQINVSDILSGLYFVKISTNSGKDIFQKIIINK